MTSAAVDLHRVRPWTEEEYLALGESLDRVELFDGRLTVPPSPTPDHQNLSLLLALALRPPARAAGMKVYLAVNVRLRHGRIAIPDLVVVEPVDPHMGVIDASAVRLVGEVVSPSNAANDRVRKMRYYAEARIGWYLLVERQPDLQLQLYRLDGDRYTLDHKGHPGAPLRLTEPLRLDLDPATLEE